MRLVWAVWVEEDMVHLIRDYAGGKALGKFPPLKTLQGRERCNS
jgi:hypothetical protein